MNLKSRLAQSKLAPQELGEWPPLNLGEFILDYEDARASDDPAGTVLGFLQETYRAAAELARWESGESRPRDATAGAIRPSRH